MPRLPRRSHLTGGIRLPENTNADGIRLLSH
jgi:hypothetical protein